MLNDPDFTTQLTDDGSHTLLSKKFGETYHSTHGAIQESRHVFIQAGLCALKNKENISILELGFGTGLNAWLSVQFSEVQKIKVSYTGLEAYPIPLEIAQVLNYPQLTGISADIALFNGLHALLWEHVHEVTPFFYFEKKLVSFLDFRSDPGYDIIFHDAFGPGVQPELWTNPFLQHLFNALYPGGLLVTYGAQGEFRRQLRTAGFEVEKLPGPPGKREMTRAWKP